MNDTLDGRLHAARISRRSMLAATGAALGIGWARRGDADEAADVPVTGAAAPGMESFDRLMTTFVRENQVPGAALAVARGGRLAYARGFGLADVEAKRLVEPTALFRIASVSKPLTAVAVMQLVERGRIGLDDPVMKRMKLAPLLSKGAKADPRWRRITVRQCLQHTGGWDRAKSFDPIGRPWEIAKAFGKEPPVSPDQIVRHMMGQPLDFDPGGKYAYSNLGYLVLGRVVEAATGMRYDDVVKRDVLGPLGVTAPRLGRAVPEGRAANEARYYDSKNRTGRSLFPPRVGQTVPLQYGAENLDGFEAHGGWIASAVDLAKFASAFDDPDRCPLLKRETIDLMWSRPAGAAGMEKDGRPAPSFYGCGWSVRPVGADGRVSAWHTGLIAGSESLLVRRFDGLVWAVLFNTEKNVEGKSLAGRIDGRLHEAAAQVTAWPEGDRFDEMLKAR